MDKGIIYALGFIGLILLLIFCGLLWSIKALENSCPNGQCPLLTITTTETTTN